jgi:hypothetical protein
MPLIDAEGLTNRYGNRIGIPMLHRHRRLSGEKGAPAAGL